VKRRRVLPPIKTIPPAESLPLVGVGPKKLKKNALKAAQPKIVPILKKAGIPVTSSAEETLRDGIAQFVVEALRSIASYNWADYRDRLSEVVRHGQRLMAAIGIDDHATKVSDEFSHGTRVLMRRASPQTNDFNIHARHIAEITAIAKIAVDHAKRQASLKRPGQAPHTARHRLMDAVVKVAGSHLEHNRLPQKTDANAGALKAGQYPLFEFADDVLAFAFGIAKGILNSSQLPKPKTDRGMRRVAALRSTKGVLVTDLGSARARAKSKRKLH
jgi:hypothetical protein